MATKCHLLPSPTVKTLDSLPDTSLLMIVLPDALGVKLVVDLPLVAIDDHNEVGLSCLPREYVFSLLFNIND